MTTDQSPPRIGAAAAIGGAAILFVSTLLHPSGSDPNDPLAAFAEYAADALWVWSHLGQFVGFAALAMALIALAGTLEPGRTTAWAHIGLAGTAASVAMAAALQAVDGVALKAMVDRWAAATSEARVLAYEGAFAVRQVEIGLAALLSLLLGLTVTAFGAALLRSDRYPTWLGGVAFLGGAGLVSAGLALAATGFSGLAMTLNLLASSVLLGWAVLAGILMWRLPVRAAAGRDAP